MSNTLYEYLLRDAYLSRLRLFIIKCSQLFFKNGFVVKRCFLYTIVFDLLCLMMKEIYIPYQLTLSRWRPLSYRNQSIDLLCKSMDWFLYDNGLRLKRAKDRLKDSNFGRMFINS